VSESRDDRVGAVILPFVIYTAIWGSTWFVIRGQIGAAPPQWSVAFRFALASVAMAIVARIRGEDLRIGWRHAGDVALLGIAQFSLNFNAVYLAERHITSGIVATVFALLLIPSSLLGWAMLGQKVDRRFLVGSTIAIVGVALLFLHEIRGSSVDPAQVVVGLGWTIAGMAGASIANVYQARPAIRHVPLFSLLAWSMAAGAVADSVIAFAVAGPPVLPVQPLFWAGLLYLATFASVIAFSLYYPVVRRIGPAKAAYSSMIVPVIAMALSTAFEGYRWTGLTIAGAALVLTGMAVALGLGRPRIAPPDAA
jgi:drug/metabolite transporter (DMT)-like permease